LAKWFASAFNAQCFAAIDALVDPENGVYLLSNPGAQVTAERYANFSELYRKEGASPGVDLDKTRINAPRSGARPVFDCFKESHMSGAVFGPLARQDNVLIKWGKQRIEFETERERARARQYGSLAKVT
jgi:hypothetical protein